MQDKIALLMEETGCDRGEAELALEMCGFQVEEAIKTIARLLKNILVLKGRFVHPDHDQFGLFLLVINLKNSGLLRSRAVLSFNPAVFAGPLEKDWFEFEKQLFGFRLLEGSRPTESLEIEQSLAAHFGSRSPAALEKLAKGAQADLLEEVAGLLRPLFSAPVLKLQLTREILDVGQFHALRAEPERAGRRKSARPRGDEQLVLKVVLERDGQGMPASELQAGDGVGATIVDTRDIAQYLGKLFGGHSDAGPMPVLAPVEALESTPKGLLVRVRFSAGVCGDAVLEPEAKVRVIRRTPAEAADEQKSWWRRFFRAE